MKKRMFSLLTAMVVAVMSLVSTVVSAADKDPNGDGKIDLSDAVYIMQCLAGVYKPADLEQLDFDSNNIVSSNDCTMIQRYNLGLDSNASLQSISTRTVTDTYNVYNAKTGTFLRSYGLSYEEESGSGSQALSQTEMLPTPGKGNSPNDVIGTDDRFEDYSNKFAVKIITTTFGSGFVVGPHTVATAAHCVFNKNNKQAYKISQMLIFNGSKENVIECTPVEAHVPLVYITSSDINDRNDYALITVKEDLSPYIDAELGMVTDSSAKDTLTVGVVGFPATVKEGTVEKTVNSFTKHNEYLGYGSIIGIDNEVITYNVDTKGGNSGGAVYATEYYNGVATKVIVGIHVRRRLDGSANEATRITARELKFFKNTSNQNW